jgi:ribosomal protein L40E
MDDSASIRSLKLVCPRCNHANPPGSWSCQNCTETLPKTLEPSSLDLTPQETREQQDNKCKGVSGWLFFLCLVLTTFSPLRAVYNLVQGYSENSPHFARFPGLQTVMFIDIPLTLALIAFSIYAGSGLWQIRARAVQTAKRYFLVSLAYVPIGATLPFMAGLPQEATSAMVPEVIKAVVQSVIGAAIWLAYLNGSKRVKATYPDAA